MQALADNPVLVIACTVLLLAVIVLGRRIELKVGSVHAQLLPNGSKSLRDAIDRIETKADTAVSCADEAAKQAAVAATHAAEALARIELLDHPRSTPSATVNVIHPMTPPDPLG